MFYHFPTKEALFDAMLHHYGDSITPEPEHLEHLPEPSTLGLVQIVFTFVRRVIVREPKQGHEMMHFFYRSFTEDGKFARQFLATGVKDLRLSFEKHLEAARAAGDAKLTGVPPYNLFWFTQHVATAACMIRLPAKPAVRYQGSLETAVEQMVLFILRGMGLTDVALEKYATPATFAAWRAPHKLKRRSRRAPVESGPVVVIAQ